MSQKTTTEDNDKIGLEDWLRQKPEEALEITGMMDGHSIFDPEVLSKMPEHLRQRFIKTHESGNTHKSTIYVDGKPVKELEGVDAKSVLWKFANALGLDYDIYHGRGSQAREHKRVIKEELEDE